MLYIIVTPRGVAAAAQGPPQDTIRWVSAMNTVLYEISEFAFDCIHVVGVCVFSAPVFHQWLK